MPPKIWLPIIIGLIIFSLFLTGCVCPGPTAMASQPSADAADQVTEVDGLDPRDPNFWLDYQTKYGAGR
jgi:hypothetical protein